MAKEMILLIPKPTNDPLDPLVQAPKTWNLSIVDVDCNRLKQNWPQRKKYVMLAILCLAAFSGTAGSVVNQLAFEIQGRLYHKTLVEMSYSISAAIAGVAFGPLLIVPLAKILGNSSAIWWSLVGAMACNIWAASMTDSNQYIPFVISRLFAGILGSVPAVLGATTITDLFFLHERGRSFLVLSLSFLLGTVAGPTFGGFIVEHVDWPVEFWWVVGLQGAASVLVFLFLEETGYNRDGGPIYPKRPKSFMANRIATFFFGTKVVPTMSYTEVLHSAIAPFVIGLSPVTVLTGTFQLLSFGWFVMINTLLTVFLQEPRKAGGYGFTPQQNAEFTFSIWSGVIFAQIYGHYLNDWLPLWICRRHGGLWKPEYRLHALWLPSLILLPIGLGIVGAALQYHTHYMVLALGVFVVTFSAMLSVPITFNYIVECFRQHELESSAIMATYRLVLGLAVPFFIDAWRDKVGIGWVFGMAAFFSIASFMLLVLLIWKGHEIRGMGFSSITDTEEGSRITDEKRPESDLSPVSETTSGL